MDQTIGWSHTTLKDETKEIINKLNVDEKVFEYYRNVYKCDKPKAIRYKYQCPDCGNKISHYKEINLKCADCDLKMESPKENGEENV